MMYSGDKLSDIPNKQYLTVETAHAAEIIRGLDLSGIAYFAKAEDDVIYLTFSADCKGEIILTPLTHITTEYENIVGDKSVSLTSYDPEKDEHTEIPLKNGVFHIPVEHCTLWYHLDDETCVSADVRKPLQTAQKGFFS